MDSALFSVIVAVTFVSFPQIFSPKRPKIFVHLMLVYGVIEFFFKLTHRTVFHVYLHSVLVVSLESRGQRRGLCSRW